MAGRKGTPEAELRGFIAAYTRDIGELARAALTKMRSRLAGAVELVYDNYNGLAIVFGPSERTSEAIFSVVLYPRWVSLFFVKGAELKDPEKLLKGSGKAIRHIVLRDAATLDEPAVRSLVKQALDRAAKRLDDAAPNRIVIKSVSPNRRPRRPA